MYDHNVGATNRQYQSGVAYAGIYGPDHAWQPATLYGFFILIRLFISYFKVQMCQKKGKRSRKSNRRKVRPKNATNASSDVKENSRNADDEDVPSENIKTSLFREDSAISTS